MRIPESPPDVDIQSLFASLEEFDDAFNRCPADKYLHWDELRRRKPPRGVSHEQWWFITNLGRKPKKPIPLKDKHGRAFEFALPDLVQEQLHLVDQKAGGAISASSPAGDATTRNRYIISALMEEAIRSSQLEGAVTTRKVAKEMIRKGRAPRDKSERMILNNYRTMSHIRQLRDESITPDAILTLHHELTEGTLDDPEMAGRLRKTDDVFVQDDASSSILHYPPSAKQLPRRLKLMCDFANEKTPGAYIHPTIRAIILHFWLAYDHPFVDGNGRCARALLYWLLLNKGYWLFEFVSVSRIMRQAPAKYARAYLHTETDENDLTYFILYNLRVMLRAIDSLHDYLEEKAKQMKKLQSMLQSSHGFNYRQRALLTNALQHPGAEYTVKSHQRSHNVALQTARSDLRGLEKNGLLMSRNEGKVIHFRPPRDLAKLLKVQSKGQS